VQVVMQMQPLKVMTFQLNVHAELRLGPDAEQPTTLGDHR
jgi:hypothetical protein